MTVLNNSRREYGPLLDGNSITKEDRKSQKLVLAAYLSSPVYEVRLLLPFGIPEDDVKLRVDLLATCYDQALLQYKDILMNGLMNATPCCNMKEVSCVNCVEVVKKTTHSKLELHQLMIGDYANKVHIYNFIEVDDPVGYRLKKDGMLVLNDCIYMIHQLKDGLIVITRRGIYVYSWFCYKHKTQEQKTTSPEYNRQILRLTYCSKEIYQCNTTNASPHHHITALPDLYGTLRCLPSDLLPLQGSSLILSN